MTNAQSHCWRFIGAVAAFHGQGTAEGRGALRLLLEQKPRTQWAKSSEWWLAMCALAKASFDGSAEEVRRALANVASINPKLWKFDDGSTEAALASGALAVASVAVARGLDLRPAPHPSW